MLKIENVTKSYLVGSQVYEVLKGINIEVKKGEFLAIMGSSGSGKTTLLNSISSYIPIDSGKILLEDREISGLSEEELSTVRNQDLGFVFQDFMLLNGLSVKDNIMLPRIISGKIDPTMEESAERLCDIFGISHIKNKYPAEISGGEKQRTAVSRALINNPKLILADEPTGNLDSKSSRAVIESFLQAKENLSVTIFMVTHDSFAASFCDRVVMLKDGLVWNSLSRGEKTRIDFQDELLEEIKVMSEED